MLGKGKIALPDTPVLAVRARSGVLIHPNGEIQDLTPTNARVLVNKPVIICHARVTAKLLGLDTSRSLDVLELFAFVRPAKSCLPTIPGLSAAVGQSVPLTLNDDAITLIEVVRTLLSDIMKWSDSEKSLAHEIAAVLDHAGWVWGPSVLAALGASRQSDEANLSPLKVWSRLKRFEDQATKSQPGNLPVDPDEIQERLSHILGTDAERREVQREYACILSHAFRAKNCLNQPNVVIAEAGTGVGKTLGYLAPASIWAEKNDGPVWISTFTRNLQRQLEQELDHVYPDPQLKAERVVMRKGRENYFCLLNYEEALNRAHADPNATIPLGLIARWITATISGDLVGGDFPAWLGDLFGPGRVQSLTDRRGECLFSACPHYNTCFVEKTVRSARTADIVIANHALVMVQAAMGGLDDNTVPSRYVLDEGHHLFGAADNAFSAHLSGIETAELRRWLLGTEAGGRPTRSRGLKRRVTDFLVDLSPDSEILSTSLDAMVNSARALPAPGWQTRLENNNPRGLTEQFLSIVRSQVYVRADTASRYSLQTEIANPIDGLLNAAEKLEIAFQRLVEPTKLLIKTLSGYLERPTNDIESSTLARIDGICRSLERRAIAPLTAWRQMLKDLEHATPEEFIDWFGVDRIEGIDSDVGLHRHWVDPTLPFVRSVMDPAQGVTITSATLRDATGDDVKDWESADQQVGAHHISEPAIRVTLPSPFDYGKITRVFIVTDVRKDSLVQVANAYRDLFLAANGGALGIFTAISRLQATYNQITPALNDTGISLYAQHIDPLPTATLVDIFRAEEDACLLGTDAVRDGVDVPGHSLRLMVFDRVPWPRPDILHRARRKVFGARLYDDRITRMRLKQAFGRLIRQEADRGVFVLLDSMMPSRLLAAFPKETVIERGELSDVIHKTHMFLRKDGTNS